MRNMVWVVARPNPIALVLAFNVRAVPQARDLARRDNIEIRYHSIIYELIEDAKILEESGCFALVLEKVPSKLAAKVANNISIPVIGIGAGDAFVGVFAACLSIGKSSLSALSFACVAGGLTCLAEGAQTSLLSSEEIERNMERLSPPELIE